MATLEETVRLEVEKQLNRINSIVTAAEALQQGGLNEARTAQQDAIGARQASQAALEEAHEARRIAGLATVTATAANQAAEAAKKALQATDQHIADVMYAKFKDFFHDALLRYTDYNRKDYDRTLRDWAFEKFKAWRG
jgi:aspartate/tyrosine/aromatic aminotransferase